VYIVLGATGHVGGAVADVLLEEGESVTVVTRQASRTAALAARGARVLEADVRDSGALREVFRQGRRAFLLNPPASPDGDTDQEERRTMACIVDALRGSGLEFVVAQSTYGAQPCGSCGDLSVLYEFEQALAAQAVPATIIRAAYYYSNWDGALESARSRGILQTPYPADFRFPMVAPEDLGLLAATLLSGPPRRGTYHQEGPRRYSPADVARVLSETLGRPIQVTSTPQDEWVRSFQELGFSKSAAQSYARMTAIALEGSYVMPDQPIRGNVTLESYIAARLAEAK
jgi:uncharacterized protein YbjT (DUF2867 family)